MENNLGVSAGLPIGSVISYGGDLSVAANLTVIQNLGWLLCDGTSYPQGSYPALFAAIGNSNGGGNGNFNVPDLRGRFVRGSNDSGNNVDPDGANRIAAAPGGATGNNVGSLQTSATALPYNTLQLEHAGLHTHTCTHLTSDMQEAWNGSTYTMARWSGNATVDVAGAHSHTITGYDATTTPINVSIYFIIKANEPGSPDGTLPVAAITAFSGQQNGTISNWVRCNGAAYGLTVNPDLFNVLSYNFGGDGISVYNVPDFRGYFLRGTSHSTGRDPDAAGRHALNTGGNTGDNIGSAQFTATDTGKLTIGTTGAHSHNITLVPQNDHHIAWGASGPLAYNIMEWTDDLTTSSQDGDHNHSVIGGDKETRPENISVDFFISGTDLANAAPPIGSIMSFGGDITDPIVYGNLMAAGWLPCDGSPCKINSFNALYQVIGGIYGSDPLKFNLPDLRGNFVIGAGSITVGTKQTASTTGTPVNPIITSTDGNHQHTMYNIPTDTHVIDVVAGCDCAENNPNASPTSSNGDHTHTFASGGDNESRPINVNVDYIIRFK